MNSISCFLRTVFLSICFLQPSFASDRDSSVYEGEPYAPHPRNQSTLDGEYDETHSVYGPRISIPGLYGLLDELDGKAPALKRSGSAPNSLGGKAESLETETDQDGETVSTPPDQSHDQSSNTSSSSGDLRSYTKNTLPHPGEFDLSLRGDGAVFDPNLAKSVNPYYDYRGDSPAVFSGDEQVGDEVVSENGNNQDDGEGK